MAKLETFVLRMPGAREMIKEGAGYTAGRSGTLGTVGGYSANPMDSRGFERLSKAVKQDITIETEMTDEGERLEIAGETDTLAVGISLPFTLIEPVETTVAPQAAGDSWGIAAIGADALDEHAGAGATVAVLDTGIAKDHDAFTGVDPVTRNFTQEEDEDVDGHGTHCAGTIFGQDVGGQRIGVARGIRRPLIAKVIGRRGGNSQAILDAIWWARGERASVISMSLGIDFPRVQKDLVAQGLVDIEATSVALRAYRDNLRAFDLLSKMFADGAGFPSAMIIAASGNESNRRHSETTRPYYTIAASPPAAADDIVSVGALDCNGQVAFFSNTLPECTAPGVDILSASHKGGLRTASGTSMATPHVAGLAAVKAVELSRHGPFNGRDLRQAVLAKATRPGGSSKADVGVGQITVV